MHSGIEISLLIIISRSSGYYNVIILRVAIIRIVDNKISIAAVTSGGRRVIEK